MKIRTIMLCTLALTLGSHAAYADNGAANSGPRYTPRPEISQNDYTQKNIMEDRKDTKSYNAYEQREPCQHYRKPPRNYIDGCGPAAAKAATPHHEKIVSSYTVLFDFDKSDNHQRHY